ncbi:single-stranded DNA-binding protein [Variovorax sp. LT1P1]|uniref:single-stranded DNA-binding protein n=1 Tax=Variovorax sp. LT1P1 TaxID=3443730 RepID=UPI003F458E45
MSLNRAQIIGRLGQDPVSRTFPNGDQVCNVSVATTDKWKDKQSGEMREATEWHRLVFTGRLAEIAAQYLRKGAQVFVEGQMRTRKYQDKDGVERYTTEIRVNEMQMLGGKSDANGDDQDGGGTRDSAPRSRAPAVPPGGGGGGFEDDIPFQSLHSSRAAMLAC